MGKVFFKMSETSLLKDEFIKGSIILFVMINIFNFLNYLFHFSMARILGPADYGVLSVLMSIGYILGVSSESIHNIVSRYTSRFNLNRKYGKIKNLLKKGFKKGFRISFIIFLLYLPFAFLMSILLNIDFWLLVIVGILIFLDFFAPIARGILQGVKKFTELGISMISEGGSKLIIALLLVSFGLKVYGAITAVVLSILVSIILTLFFLGKIIKSREERADVKEVYSYSLSFFIAMISIILMFSVDVIIARIIFSPEIVGKYAVASILGKMIFLATQPISKAMFPFASESFDNNKNTRHLLYKALGFLFLLCSAALIIFLLFPEFLINLLFGANYVDVAGILIFAGISFSILSFTNLLVFYALSKNKKNFSFYLPIFVVIEISLLLILSSTLLQYSLALLFSNILMLLGALILIKNENKHNNPGA